MSVPNRTWRRCVWPVVVSLLVVTLSTCGGGRVISAGDVTVLVSGRPSGGMDAQGGGRLEVVGGCLGASGSVIVWPHGTEVVDEDPLTVDVQGYGTFGLGQEVLVGGGYVLEHRAEDVEPGPFEVAGIIVPASCAAHDVFLAR